MKNRLDKIFDNFKRIVVRITNIMLKDELKTLPGHLAFFLVLSIIPILSIISVIASLYGVSLTSVVTFIKGSIPNDIYELLLPFISEFKITGNVLFFIVVALLLASNGPHAIILASNALYKTEEEDYIHRRVKAFWITIVLVIVFFFTLFIVTSGSFILKTIFSLGFFKSTQTNAVIILWFFKYPFAYILIYFATKLIYTIAPNVNISSKSVTKGAIFTTIGWLLVSYIFSYYMTNIASYDLLYGSLASIIAMMIWSYLLSTILVIGIAINADNYLMNKK